MNCPTLRLFAVYFVLFPLQRPFADDNILRKLRGKPQITVLVDPICGLLDAPVLIVFAVVAVEVQIFGVHIGQIHLDGNVHWHPVAVCLPGGYGGQLGCEPALEPRRRINRAGIIGGGKQRNRPFRSGGIKDIPGGHAGILRHVDGEPDRHAVPLCPYRPDGHSLVKQLDGVTAIREDIRHGKTGCTACLLIFLPQTLYTGFMKL